MYNVVKLSLPHSLDSRLSGTGSPQDHVTPSGDGHYGTEERSYTEPLSHPDSLNVPFVGVSLLDILPITGPDHRVQILGSWNTPTLSS